MVNAKFMNAKVRIGICFWDEKNVSYIYQFYNTDVLQHITWWALPAFCQYAWDTIHVMHDYQQLVWYMMTMHVCRTNGVYVERWPYWLTTIPLSGNWDGVITWLLHYHACVHMYATQCHMHAEWEICMFSPYRHAAPNAIKLTRIITQAYWYNICIREPHHTMRIIRIVQVSKW